NTLAYLSISFEKNSIEIVQPIPPTIKIIVYSKVVTPICLVAYVGNIGTSIPIEAPCKNIPGNNNKCLFVTSTISVNCFFPDLFSYSVNCTLTKKNNTQATNTHIAIINENLVGCILNNKFINIIPESLPTNQLN